MDMQTCCWCCWVHSDTVWTCRLGVGAAHSDTVWTCRLGVGAAHSDTVWTCRLAVGAAHSDTVWTCRLGAVTAGYTLTQYGHADLGQLQLGTL